MTDFNTAAPKAEKHPHPFGTTDAGKLAHALDTLFYAHKDTDPDDVHFKTNIRSWLIEKHTALSVVSKHTPILPLLLCRAYAAVDELDMSKKLYQFCLRNDAVWENFDQGDQKSQNLAKKHSLRFISDKLSLTPREAMTLQERRLFEGGDSYALNDIVYIGLHCELVDDAWEIAKQAYAVFIDNIYVATNTLRVVPFDQKLSWLEELCCNFPNHRGLQDDLERAKAQKNNRNTPSYLNQTGWR